MSASFASFVYVANADTQDISVFGLTADGMLTPIVTEPVQTPAVAGKSMLLAHSPDHRILYAAYFTQSGRSLVASFAVAADSGRLQLLGTTSLADSMSYMTTDRAGRQLLCASYGGNKVTVNAIGDDGRVGALTQLVMTAPKAHCIVTDPANRHVLHTSLGADLIYQRHFDPISGLLSANSPATVLSRAQSGPRFLTFSADGRFVYVVCELDGGVDVYPFDAGAGLLQPQIQRTSTLPPGFAGQAWAADIRLSANGRFLFTSERTSSTLTGFRVDAATGRLSPGTCYETASRPRGIAVDPGSEFLVAAGQLSNSVACHRIDPASGALRRLGEYAVGRNPTWVEILAA